MDPIFKDGSYHLRMDPIIILIFTFAKSSYDEKLETSTCVAWTRRVMRSSCRILSFKDGSYHYPYFSFAKFSYDEKLETSTCVAWTWRVMRSSCMDSII
ncbi:hypothetical protein TNCT_43731 [Trichonephila clavata]|uniref:Uncharacterized protein n=1 Tax=Trichonephila clavata TaxID=2740835 RepID=A0A8X6M0W1_TRICU|nr:hypothetical protein TNCT_43731 [Trichonephila clavata]